MKLAEQIKDWYLTKKTSKTKAERDYDEWYFANVCLRSTEVKRIFHGFEYIITVDPDKFFQFDPFAWAPCEDAREYFWPARAPKESCVFQCLRVMKAPSTAWEWHINEIGGEDRVFVATNSEADAAMIALKYS